MDTKKHKHTVREKDMAQVLSTVFDVVFKVLDDGQLEFYDSEQAIFNKITSIDGITLKKDAQKLYKLIASADKKKDVKTIRIRLNDTDYNVDWVDVNIVRDDKGNSLFLALKDITEGQRRIEKLSEAGIFDPLTGAYHRSKLKDFMLAMDKPNNLPIAFFIFDINGIKIINDVFGYDEGNSLLVKCATIISLAAPVRGKLVRMSGDEFLLIVPKCKIEEQRYIANKINQYAKEETTELITPDISIGIGTKETPKQSLETTLRKTKDNLIAKRSREGGSFKNSIIKDLLRHLSIKNFETTKHVLRVKGLSLMLGESLGLDQEQMNTLSLAADIHDIGKVMIPENILAKKGNLSDSDWNEIKLHPITSYSIANALPRYKSTANAILYHHECWDGSGYPEGLKGDRIPLLSRILTVVDAYDIMQNTTHYRTRTFTQKEALREIKRCAGTQFDPNLVRYFVKIMSPQENMRNYRKKY